jgi:hypothetical protein
MSSVSSVGAVPFCDLNFQAIRVVAHAMVFIKTDDQGFIHEPNFATLALSTEEAIKELWNVSRKFYLEEGLCSITFFAVTK